MRNIQIQINNVIKNIKTASSDFNINKRYFFIPIDNSYDYYKDKTLSSIKYKNKYHHTIKKEMEDYSYIYWLSTSKKIEDIKYIGSTKNYYQRLYQHISLISPNNDGKNEWIMNNVMGWKKLYMIILDKEVNSNIKDLEKEYITYFSQNKNITLVNIQNNKKDDWINIWKEFSLFLNWKWENKFNLKVMNSIYIDNESNICRLLLKKSIFKQTLYSKILEIIILLWKETNQDIKKWIYVSVKDLLLKFNMLDTKENRNEIYNNLSVFGYLNNVSKEISNGFTIYNSKNIFQITKVFNNENKEKDICDGYIIKLEINNFWSSIDFEKYNNSISGKIQSFELYFI